MLYRNTKTGVTINVKSPVSGEFWEPVEAEAKPEPEKPKKTKAVKTNAGKRK